MFVFAERSIPLLLLFLTGMEYSFSWTDVPIFNARGFELEISNVAMGVVVFIPIFPITSVPNKNALPEFPR